MLKNILAAAIIAALSLPAFAVTDKEMEEAKAITAQAYLRYANDGSGYLDDFRASSMSQLESKLKAKEKENLKAFNTVKIPSDYASWDKDKLVEFWSVTFFTSPNLAEKGKAARSRVKQRISALTIAAAKAAETPAVAETTTTTTEETTSSPAPVISDTIVTSPAATREEILEKQEDILADQNAIAQDTEDRQYRKEDNSTWIYVVVLVVLIGVVIWLVVFAANMMKKQAEPLEAAKTAGSSDSPADSGDTENLREELASTRTALNEYKAAFEESQDENKNMQTQIKSLKNEITKLKEELASAAAAAVASAAKAAPAPAAPRKDSREGIYLGRVNNRGLFVRADRRYNPGHSIYRLETRDGLVGTFHLINAQEVTDLGLDNPVVYLSGGCSAIDIEDTAGATTIVTENAGTAMFENGAWKVLRKSKIRFE